MLLQPGSSRPASLNVDAVRLIAYGTRGGLEGGYCPSKKTLFITLYPNLV
jgi:hypothetical protein